MNLNTSHVTVKHLKKIYKLMGINDLNTSHVTVKQYHYYFLIKILIYLNTSHVTVKLIIIEKIKRYI